VQGNLNAPAYMWGGNLSPESPMYANLASVVGGQEVDAFRQTMYSRWITEADMARIAGLGFNSVRVPIEAQDLDHYKGAWEEPDAEVANRDLVPAVLKQIIDAVRTVDTNHMVVAEGDWFATDFGPFAYGTVGQGLTYAGQTTVLPPIASIMAYMFHSYNLSGTDVNAQNNIDGFNKIAV